MVENTPLLIAQFQLVDPGGAIEDTASAAIGNIILGGEIGTLTGSIDEIKLSIINCNAGQLFTPTRYHKA